MVLSHRVHQRGSLMAMTLTLTCICVASCASPWATNKPTLDNASQPIAETSREILADWNDLDSAMLIAASKSQLGLSERTNDPDGAMYQLLTIHDETMLLWVTPLEKDVGKPIRMKLETRLDPSRDTRRETNFLDALEKRLVQLRGVDTAPVE